MKEQLEKSLKALQAIDFSRSGLFLALILAILFYAYFFISKKREHFPKALTGKKSFIIINFLLGALLLASITGVTYASPKVVSPSGPAFGVYEITDAKPLTVKFDKPVDTKKIQKEITPELSGQWKAASEDYAFLSDTLLFYPDQTPAPETRYTVSLKGIKSLLGNDSKDYLFSFNSGALPKVRTVSPDNGAEGVLPGQEITVVFDEAHEKTAKIEFATSPEIALETKKVNDKEYRIKAKDGFKKSSSYSFNVFMTPISVNFKDGHATETGEKTTIWTGAFRTLEAPGVKDYSPRDSGILADAKIVIEFRQDMMEQETQKAFSINPGTNVNIAWEGKRKLIATPTAPLAKNTSYSISVSKSAKAADGSPFEDNFSFNFATIGHVSVVSFSPGNNASGVNTDSAVSVNFNQAVDHASAQSKFSIFPQVSGNFSWSGNRMTYTHSGFSYGTKYSVGIGSGVKTVHGLDSNRSYNSSFTTKQQSITLNAPSYRQAHMYSCMASAARAALAYKKASVSEDHLLSLIGYDRTPFSGTWRDPNAIWGDPYSGTVGNIDGKSGGVNWGYGAYWGPTARAISNYRPAEAKTSWNVQGIAQEIANGNPVLVWWVNGIWPSYEVNWKTPSGKAIRGVNGMHVQVVKGFTGTVQNPTSFIVTDSGYGYPSRTFDVGTFKAKWSWFGNSAVIVR